MLSNVVVRGLVSLRGVEGGREGVRWRNIKCARPMCLCLYVTVFLRVQGLPLSTERAGSQQ